MLDAREVGNVKLEISAQLLDIVSIQIHTHGNSIHDCAT